MEDVICKAEMKIKSSKIFKILIILLFILGIIVFIPVSYEFETFGLLEHYYDYHNIFGTSVYIKFPERFPYISGTFSIINLTPFFLGIIMLIWKISIKFIIKHCLLDLKKDGIIGKRKYLFSSKLLQLPIEKIDSILIENRIIDKMLGGQTIAIRSASGLIRFICVQNASEFVDKTLEAIKAYQESSQPNDVNIPTNTGGDNLEKIQKLKEMLDSDIITQDEFDTKKKQLLGL